MSHNAVSWEFESRSHLRVADSIANQHNRLDILANNDWPGFENMIKVVGSLSYGRVIASELFEIHAFKKIFELRPTSKPVECWLDLYPGQQRIPLDIPFAQ